MKVTIFLKKSWIVILVILVSIIGSVIFWRGKQIIQAKTVQGFEDARGLQIEADQLSGLNINFPGGEKNSYWLLNFAKFTDLGTAGALENIDGEYYRDSKLIYRLTAISGITHWQSQELKLDDPVIIAVDQTKSLSAEEMFWGPKARNISAKGQVVVRINDLIIRTEELTADFRLERIVFKGMTTATPK